MSISQNEISDKIGKLKWVNAPGQQSDWIAQLDASANDGSWEVVYRVQPSIAIFSGLNEKMARLIAAAPDLYDAIRNSDDAHWTTAMRAAMAKAEGR